MLVDCSLEIGEPVVATVGKMSLRGSAALGAIIATLALGGCGGGQAGSEASLRAHGYSSEYVDGYHDGCPAGEAAAGELFRDSVRDEARYSAGGDYRTGWDYGFLHCKQEKERELAIAEAIGAALAGSLYDGHTNHGSDGVDAKSALRGVDKSAIRAAGW